VKRAGGSACRVLYCAPNGDVEVIDPLLVATRPSNEELAAHYAAACGGDLERALLMALDSGFAFDRAVTAMGDRGVRTAFQCLLKGWIERGQITGAGRLHLQRGAGA
jgi:hypothetical protein